MAAWRYFAHASIEFFDTTPPAASIYPICAARPCPTNGRPTAVELTTASAR
jgi:hypothetical protein